MTAKKVLNVGGGSKDIPLPPQYAGYEHVLLDIDASDNPDIVCDARQLTTLQAGQFDAIYCSHNLEHYYRHDVHKVLQGFLHVLKEDGFAHIRVPDMAKVMEIVAQHRLDIDDVLYRAGDTPITVLDVIYGLGSEIEQSGNDFYAHKTGFTHKSLTHLLQLNGFQKLYGSRVNLEIVVIACKSRPSEDVRRMFGLPGD